MFRTAAVLLAALFASAASAQVHYGGYDLGPDYDAMIRNVLDGQRKANDEMLRQTQALVAQAMQDRQCQAMYQQHLAAGGTLSFPDFAYQYVATAHFSGPGIARYRDTERDNQRREHDAYLGVLESERNLAGAIAEGNEHFSGNQDEFRRVLGGESTWVDPNGGHRVSLPYVGDEVPYADQNGYVYQRDAAGHYRVRDLNGYWHDMEPAR